jgi:hypothetical protein
LAQPKKPGPGITRGRRSPARLRTPSQRPWRHLAPPEAEDAADLAHEASEDEAPAPVKDLRTDHLDFRIYRV